MRLWSWDVSFTIAIISMIASANLCQQKYKEADESEKRLITGQILNPTSAVFNSGFRLFNYPWKIFALLQLCMRAKSFNFQFNILSGEKHEFLKVVRRYVKLLGSKVWCGGAAKKRKNFTLCVKLRGGQQNFLCEKWN